MSGRAPQSNDNRFLSVEGKMILGDQTSIAGLRLSVEALMILIPEATERLEFLKKIGEIPVYSDRNSNGSIQRTQLPDSFLDAWLKEGITLEITPEGYLVGGDAQQMVGIEITDSDPTGKEYIALVDLLKAVTEKMQKMRDKMDEVTKALSVYDFFPSRDFIRKEESEENDNDSIFSLSALEKERNKIKIKKIKRFIKIEKLKDNVVLKCSEIYHEKWYKKWSREAFYTVMVTGGKVFGFTYGAFWYRDWESMCESAKKGGEDGRLLAMIIIRFIIRIFNVGREAMMEDQFAKFLAENKVGGILFCYLLTITVCHMSVQPLLLPHEKIFSSLQLEKDLLEAINEKRTFNNTLEINELIDSCEKSFQIFLEKNEKVIADLKSNTEFQGEDTIWAKHLLTAADEHYKKVKNLEKKTRENEEVINTLLAQRIEENRQDLQI